MMTFSLRPLAVLLLFTPLFLTACGSAVPLGEADDAGFDAALVGRWQEVDAEDDAPAELLLLKFDDNTYFGEFRDTENGPLTLEDVVRCRVYVTYIDGVPFLNAQFIDPLEEDDRRYMFLTYRMTDEGDLVLTSLEDVEGVDLEAFATTEELATFVQAHLNDDRLYGESVWFRRIADE
jgi:hypothetical protein